MLKENTYEEKSMENAEIEAFFHEETSRHADTRLHEFQKLMAYYRCAMMEIATKFNVLNEEFSLRYDRNPITGIKSRLKRLTSMRDKLQKNGYPLTLESIEKNLHDVAGVRVVCSFPEDVYMLADAFLKQDDITVISRKD